MSRLLSHYRDATTIFLCCDLQAAFGNRIKTFPQLVFVANRFARLHQLIPQQSKFIVTEQYPKALGRTVPEVLLPGGAAVVEKTKFSMMVDATCAQFGDPTEVMKPTTQVVIFGIEAHVCVQQTVADLLDRSDVNKVIVARDGVASQNAFDEEAAIQRFVSWGPKCQVSTSESIMFELVRDAKDPIFKQMSALAKEQRPLV